MSVNAYPGVLAALGIGREASFGVPVAATFALPVQAPSLTESHALIPDTGWRHGSASTYAHRLGPRQGSAAFTGPLFADAVGFPLAGVLGDSSVTGTGPYVWTFAALNDGGMQPASYTLSTDDPTLGAQWPGAMFTSAKLTCQSADGLLAVQAQATSLPPVYGATSLPEFTGTAPIPGWAGTVKFGGTVEARLIDYAVTLARPVTPKRNTNGAQAAYLNWAGQVAVSGQATVLLGTDNASYLTALGAGSVESIVASWTRGSQSLTVQSSACVFTGVQRATSAGWVEATLTWVADANTTDAGPSGGLSPVKVTLQNAVSTGY